MNRTGPVKRVTVWCRDAERSLRLYRDILGLTVLEDKVVSGPEIARLAGLRDCRLRIIHLASGDSTCGWIGLYELSQADPMPEARAVPRGDRLSFGQPAVVLETPHLEEIVAQLERGGYVFLTRPTSYRKQTGGPLPAGRYTETMFFDPDGVLVALVGFEPA
jgi:catechol 2,3-dioxygenase-like lactoylglutathione lyase family enzyme